MSNNTIKISNKNKSTNSYEWNGLQLTDSAIQKIIKIINSDSNMLGIQIAIKKSGCAGFSYHISKIMDVPNNNHYLAYNKNNIKIFVPLNIMPLIDGTKLDFIQEGLNSAFKFNNPQAQFLCGCGESFGI